MDDPLLLFCVGAAKAGTSWLYRYLADHPECHVRPIKELHYFDALDFGQVDRQIREITAARDTVLRRIDTVARGKVPRLLEHVTACEHYLELLGSGEEDIPGYLGYLAEGLVDEKVLADVTPAYSLLSEDRFAMMAGILPDVRFIYLMRDPVDRLWSHARMIAAQRGGAGSNVEALADRVLKRVFQGKEETIAERGDYRATLLKLAEVVEEGRLCIVLYEDLFDRGGTDRICDFLGIGRMPAKADLAVNAGPDLAMTEEQRAAAREWLAPQYEFLAGALPGIAARWSGGAG